MSDFKFSCPKCKQDISCDQTYAGSRIDCPTCHQNITVPPAGRTAAAPGERTIQIKASTLRNTAVIGAGVLLVAGIVVLLVRLFAGPTTLTFRSYVDGIDIVKLSGPRLWIEHQDYVPPTKTTVNGKDCNFIWTDNKSQPYDLNPAFNARHPDRIKLVKSAGRGPVAIVEMPTPANGETLAIKVDDGDYGGADWYEFTVSW
jgi:hypothetical protein